MITTLWPGDAAWRQAARMLVALAVAYALTHALHLHSGYWAMITVTVVVQGNLGGTLDAGLSQCAGTLVGGLLGVAGVWLRTHHLAPDWTVLLAVLAPLTLLSASNQHLRTGPVTALIVLLVTPAAGSSIALALGRIGEIAIGSVIGIAVSILVLPSRATAAFDRHIAEGLRALGTLAAAYANGQDQDDALERPIHHAIAGADDAIQALRREQSIHLIGTLKADPLLRSLRRLRTDVAMLGRAIPQNAALSPLAAPLNQAFQQAAESLATRKPQPPAAKLDQSAVATIPHAFVLEILQRDLTDLADRLADYISP